MLRVYLDKQILSYLRTRDGKYRELLQKIYDNKHLFMFCYSEAHLQDLSKSSDEYAAIDLEFMQTIVDSNYLVAKPNGDVGISIMTPQEAFATYSDKDSFFKKEMTLENLPSEQKHILSYLSTYFRDIKQGKYAQIGDLLKREPDGNATDEELADLLSLFKGVAGALQTKEVYRWLKDVATQSVTKGKVISKNGSSNFNEDMLKTPLNATFVDAILPLLSQAGLNTPIDIAKYQTTYILLDVFSVSSDKAKGFKISNMFTDSIHGYYGLLCDCIVSEDRGLRDKAKAISSMHNYNTAVYNFDEFVAVFEREIDLSNKCIECNIAPVMLDYRTNDIIDESTDRDIRAYELKTNHLYFGLFDRMCKYIVDGKVQLHLSKKYHKIKNFIREADVELIVNRLVGIMGEDNNCKGVLEKGEINAADSDSWEGRVWKYQNCSIILKFLPYYEGISLILVFDDVLT